MERKIKAAEVTEDVIKQWKAQYGKVFQFKAEDGKTAYFKQPDRKAVDASFAIAKTSPVRSDEIIAKNSFIGGDEEVITEDKYFYSLSRYLGQLIEVVVGELAEL
ncbi:hypothetical protein [Pinibacter soli]|uniref:Uncharacterized protein n=1 Tax=Pinibacter soli TaxID=3044211 RepID=A0ABT6R993_9BACT|nr:hypothetical protein [Pinibacter soli]MDI3319130.1 hypothetical protein [Pinibacter soli]